MSFLAALLNFKIGFNNRLVRRNLLDTQYIASTANTEAAKPRAGDRAGLIEPVNRTRERALSRPFSKLLNER